MTAPCASLTVPETVPVVTCASAAGAIIATAARNTTTLTAVLTILRPSSFNASGAPPPLALAAALEDALASRASQTPFNARGAPPPLALAAALEDSLAL